MANIIIENITKIQYGLKMIDLIVQILNVTYIFFKINASLYSSTILAQLFDQ